MGILDFELDSTWNIITKEKLDELNDKEILVFNYLLKHRSIRDIAWELNLTPGTINAHKAKIYAKLKIWPRTPMQLRDVWNKSVGLQKNIPRWW